MATGYQFGKLVMGWEADMVWGSNSGTSTTTFGAPLLPPIITGRSINVNSKWTALPPVRSHRP